MSDDAHSTPVQGEAPKSPSLATLTPRVDALREKLAKDRMASSGRKERKKSLEGTGDARSTIEGMLTARRTARKASLEAGIDPSTMAGGPPDWFISFKQGMEARVSDLENQLEEKTEEVQQLRERVEAIEERSGVAPAASAGRVETIFAEAPLGEPKARVVPKLSLGNPAEPTSVVTDLKLPTPTTPIGANSSEEPKSKITSPKLRPATAGTKLSPKGAEAKTTTKKTAADKKKEKKEGGWK